MSKNIVFEGWLTKSPPTKRIWRTKWRRRWFALRQSGELPGQYFLDYYADQNCRRLKGTINLDLCEQVDVGLHMERTGKSLDTKLRGSVFTIQTQQRTYHLEADSEADMEKWVDAICRVCGLRATEDPSSTLDDFANSISSMSAMNNQYECADTNSPYIPISECITGVRAQALTFGRQNIVVSTLERASEGKNHHMYMSQPHIRLNNAEFSENDSNLSDEECKSLNASQSNIRDWSVIKTFTKLVVSQKTNDITAPPSPPPRPPKTLGKETYQGPKIQEPMDTFCDSSLQYCNLPSLPPAVDRALKPRHSSIGHINHLLGQRHLQLSSCDDRKSDVLQYLDLDLHSSKPVPTVLTDTLAKKEKGVPEKSLSAVDADYKTVDFLKTEAFNITRQAAEASRSNHQ